MDTARFVGIDVSKAWLDVASGPDGHAARHSNTPEGISALVAWLEAGPTELIVLEATGGLERPLAVALGEAGLPARVVQPGRVRHFARAVGQHSKTDRLDAAVLAHYAQAVRPEARALPDEATRALQALLDRRRQLVAIRAAEQSRLPQATTPAVRANVEAVIAYLTAQIDKLDGRSPPPWRPPPSGSCGTRSSGACPGSGPRPRGRCWADARAGLADRAAGRGPGRPGPAGPRQRVHQAPRHLRRPRRGPRRAVHGGPDGRPVHPTLKAFYARLRGAGKPAKVALVAVGAEFLATLNAMIRDKKAWEP